MQKLIIRKKEKNTTISIRLIIKVFTFFSFSDCENIVTKQKAISIFID